MSNPLFDDVAARHPDVTVEETTSASRKVAYGGVADWAVEAVEPTAVTAGEQDHTDPWFWAGAPTDAPGMP